MSKTNWIKIALTATTVLAMVALYFYYKPISRNIDTTVAGIQFRAGAQHEDYEVIEITINGTYERYLFGNKQDLYRGYLSIEGYDFTFSAAASILLTSDELLASKTGRFGAIRYLVSTPLNIIHFGMGQFATNLEEFVVLIWEPAGGNSENWSRSLILCAPAANREEADNIIDRLVERNVIFGTNVE